MSSWRPPRKARSRNARRSRAVVQEAIATALETAVPAPAGRVRASCLLRPKAAVVDIDAGHLQQTLVNLIDNALKYSPADTPVWLRLSIEADEAVLRIEDRGVGIAPETLSHIFDLFTRAPTHAAMPGSGVGPAVVPELVALYGGSVLAQSEGVGQGAIFACGCRDAIKVRCVTKPMSSPARQTADGSAAD